MQVRLRSAWCLGLLSVPLLASGCAKPPRTATASAGPTAAAPANATAPGPVASPQASIRSLSRSRVKDAVKLGVGALLSNVSLDDWPVMRDGKFVGFRLRKLAPHWNVDLAPGDVITRINGIVPERPEDAIGALKALEKAPALTIDFERDGKAKTLELPIVDDEPARK